MNQSISQLPNQRERWLNLGRIVQSLELVQDLIVISLLKRRQNRMVTAIMLKYCRNISLRSLLQSSDFIETPFIAHISHN